MCQVFLVLQILAQGQAYQIHLFIAHHYYQRQLLQPAVATTHWTHQQQHFTHHFTHSEFCTFHSEFHSHTYYQNLTTHLTKHAYYQPLTMHATTTNHTTNFATTNVLPSTFHPKPSVATTIASHFANAKTTNLAVQLLSTTMTHVTQTNLTTTTTTHVVQIPKDAPLNHDHHYSLMSARREYHPTDHHYP